MDHLVSQQQALLKPSSWCQCARPRMLHGLSQTDTCSYNGRQAERAGPLTAAWVPALQNQSTQACVILALPCLAL